MARILCLAQRNGASKPTRSKPGGAAKPAPRPQSFTILERASVGPAHTPVWAALRKRATRQTIVDSEHPADAIAAHVVEIGKLGSEAVQAIAELLADRRAMALTAVKETGADEILSKRLDKVFAQEMEWIAIRNLLAAALPRIGSARTARRDKSAARALLLIDL